MTARREPYGEVLAFDDDRRLVEFTSVSMRQAGCTVNRAFDAPAVHWRMQRAAEPDIVRVTAQRLRRKVEDDPASPTAAVKTSSAVSRSVLPVADVLPLAPVALAAARRPRCERAAGAAPDWCNDSGSEGRRFADPGTDVRG